jgi:23S rRNA (uracil1939-C5)-methyltransferase
MTASSPQRLPRKGDVLVLCPDALDDDGAAITHLEVPIGAELHRLKVVTPGALPGDTIEARVTGRFRGTLDARVTALLAPSPDRIRPACHHADATHHRPCGGCPLQALAYPAQLVHKVARIRRHLENHGLHLDVLAPIPAVLTFHHRHKMELSFANEGRLVLGLHPSGYRWEALDLTECPVLSAATSAFIPLAAAIARDLGLAAHDVRTNAGWLETLTFRDAKRTRDRLLELTTNNAEVVATAAGPLPAAEVARTLGERLLAAHPSPADTGFVWTRRDATRGRPTTLVTALTLGRPALREILRLPDGKTLEFLVHPRAFFQPHPLQAERLVAEVIQRVVPPSQEAPRRPIRIADLYAGTGLLGLAVAPFVASVVGIELVPEAAAAARATAHANNLTHTNYLAGDVGTVLADPAHAALFADLDAVILDPPRAGLAQAAFDAVARLAPRRVVYVSCHPASLAHDLAAFAKVGYSPSGPLQPVDMFPHTPHIECVIALDRSEAL